MNKNRFNILNLDDDEQMNVAEVKEKVILEPVPKKAETRQWSLDTHKPQEVREWNMEKTKFNSHQKKGPFQRKHPFKYKHNPNEKAHFRGYSFKDESTEETTLKPPTPVNKDIEFPKLSNSPDSIKVNPSTEVHTFAEKIKLAMEKQIERESKPEEETKNTIHMFSVIPMKTKLGDSLQFLS